jgi:hypothetical protein
MNPINESLVNFFTTQHRDLCKNAFQDINITCNGVKSTLPEIVWESSKTFVIDEKGQEIFSHMTRVKNETPQNKGCVLGKMVKDSVDITLNPRNSELEENISECLKNLKHPPLIGHAHNIFDKIVINGETIR